MDRRLFLKSAAAFIAAPAIVRSGVLMPIRGLVMTTDLPERYDEIRGFVTVTQGDYDALGRPLQNNLYIVTSGSAGVLAQPHSVDGVSLQPGDRILFRDSFLR